MSAESYESVLAAWKIKHGITDASGVEIDHEAVMVTQDAQRKGKDYCVLCGDEFKIADMRLISRRDDPYIQMDDDGESRGKPDYWIAVQHRCRACKPCFKRDYGEEEQ